MVEDLFPGPALPLPPSQAGGSGLGWVVRFTADDADDLPASGAAAEREAEPSASPRFGRYALSASDEDDGVLEPGRPAVVRHAAGYGPFAEALERRRLDPAALARDLRALLAALAAHPDLLAGDDPEAAQLFFGNTLALVNPNATWRRTPALEVATGTRSIDVARALVALTETPERRAGFLESLASWHADDEQQELQQRAMDAATEAREASPLVSLPEPFEPRPLPLDVYRDDDGEVIRYGERWPDRAPDDAYSRVSHPERFALLHAVAVDLVAHLERWCDVAVHREETPEGERVLRLEPAAGAPIRMRFTPFPGLIVSAGALWSSPFPDCGCDACDETGAGGAEQLVETVLAVVAGGLTERYPIGAKRGYVSGLRTLEGGSRGSSGDATGSPEELAAAEPALAALPDGRWPAWPLRPST